MKIRLSVQNPSQKPDSITLTKTTVIGRAADCDLKLNSDLVSRRHCKIFLTDSVVLVHDLGSSNGTFINGDKLTPKRDTKLPPGSLLSVGNISFKVEYDSQEFVDVGSTIYLKNADQLLTENPLTSVSDNDVIANHSSKATASPNHIHQKRDKPHDSDEIDVNSPDPETTENKKTVQFPEIEIPDTIDEN